MNICSPRLTDVLSRKTLYDSTLTSALTAELDIFEGDLAPLMLVEVEFPSEEAANTFTAPEWFGEDVTFSGKYHNSYLSQHSLEPPVNSITYLVDSKSNVLLLFIIMLLIDAYHII